MRWIQIMWKTRIKAYQRGLQIHESNALILYNAKFKKIWCFWGDLDIFLVYISNLAITLDMLKGSFWAKLQLEYHQSESVAWSPDEQISEPSG